MALAGPPPAVTVDAARVVHERLPARTVLWRIFNPASPFQAVPLGFRDIGPIHRFDHHRVPQSGPYQKDPKRAILYAARNLEGSVVEVFGDGPRVIDKTFSAVQFELRASLTLLDLRASGAMRAGTTAALSSDKTRTTSQSWARYFYEHPDTYRMIDGLVYSNAHNGLDAIALFDRAREVVSRSRMRVFRMTGKRLDQELQRIAFENLMVLPID